MVTDNIDSCVARPRRYQNIDGTVEIGFGILYLMSALKWYLMPPLSGWADLTFGMLPLVAMVFLVWWVPIVIKKHITWPRTGYVAQRKTARSRLAAFGGGGLVAVAFLWVLRTGDGSLNVGRIVVLAMAGAPYFILMVKNREQAWKWLVAVWLWLGLAVIGAAVPGSAWDLFPPVFLFAGLTWLASGLITLWLYIRHTQPPGAEKLNG